MRRALGRNIDSYRHVTWVALPAWDSCLANATDERGRCFVGFEDVGVGLSKEVEVLRR